MTFPYRGYRIHRCPARPRFVHQDRGKTQFGYPGLAGYLLDGKISWGAITATAGMTFGMYGVLFLLPLTWQSAGRRNATAAGIALIPMALVFVPVSPFSGALAVGFGSRIMMAGGVAIIGIGLLLIGLSAHQVSLMPAEIGLSLAGLGMGLATGPLMGTAVGAVGASRPGTASALINVARMAGATVSVAILGTVFAMPIAAPTACEWRCRRVGSSRSYAPPWHGGRHARSRHGHDVCGEPGRTAWARRRRCFGYPVRSGNKKEAGP
jgi:MFS family permease